jgi:spermidine synthase
VDPERAKWPTSYYGEGSGIAMAFEALPDGPRRIGVIGLGTGSVTVYARPGDSVRIYEINSQVEKLANSRFTYLNNTRDLNADVKVVLGDARLSLEREPSQQFDLLVLDAFSSDAIPVHLLTKESFAVYQKHLNPNGIIVVHISNRYLDLEPVVINLAKNFGFKLATVDYDEDEPNLQWWLYGSTWVLLSKNQSVIDTPSIHDANTDHAASTKAYQKAAKVPLWTDDFTSLFQILK